MSKFVIFSVEPQFSGEVKRIYRFKGTRGDMSGNSVVDYLGCSLEKADRFDTKGEAEIAAKISQKTSRRPVMILEV